LTIRNLGEQGCLVRKHRHRGDQLEVISGDGQRLAGGRPSNGGRASYWRADRQDALRWEPVREEEES
jgi:hypothetical protein